MLSFLGELVEHFHVVILYEIQWRLGGWIVHLQRMNNGEGVGHDQRREDLRHGRRRKLVFLPSLFDGADLFEGNHGSRLRVCSAYLLVGSDARRSVLVTAEVDVTGGAARSADLRRRDEPTVRHVRDRGHHHATIPHGREHVDGRTRGSGHRTRGDNVRRTHECRCAGGGCRSQCRGSPSACTEPRVFVYGRGFGGEHQCCRSCQPILLDLSDPRRLQLECVSLGCSALEAGQQSACGCSRSGARDGARTRVRVVFHIAVRFMVRGSSWGGVRALGGAEARRCLEGKGGKGGRGEERGSRARGRHPHRRVRHVPQRHVPRLARHGNVWRGIQIGAVVVHFAHGLAVVLMRMPARVHVLARVLARILACRPWRCGKPVARRCPEASESSLRRGEHGRRPRWSR
mmetsp:Transcript_11948/g.24028  ORF Transcript_11948/g.24028 Transcript_11948/m.24028 type:complete len:402 (-) Transcript_11948:652-1857(-)